MDVGTNIVQAGAATQASPLFGELLACDSRPLEPALRDNSTYYPERKPIAVSRYFDPEFAALEMQQLWKKSWQVVGREEDIPDVGDRMSYDVGTLSYIIVRTAPENFRALQNSCLHRGTRLCSGNSSGASIKCPFHGWEWNNDGSLKNIPSRWDFPDLDDKAFHLPEAKIDCWGGHLFINPDPNAGPLADELGKLNEHFTPRESEQRFTLIKFRKKIRANWKLALEAFLEAYHLAETHSQVMSFNSDTTTAYDTWDDGKSQVSRLVTPAAVPSGHLGDNASRLEAAEAALRTFAMAIPGIELPPISSGENGRAEVAEWRRQTMKAGFGVDFSTCSDAYMLDAIQYFMFPNFLPWWGEGLPLSYQFMPLGDDPNTSMMEVRLTLPLADGAPRPRSPDFIELDFDEEVAGVEALGIFAEVFDQDYTNLPMIQRGLRSTLDSNAGLTLGRYQESRVQAFNDIIDRRLAD